MLRSFLSASFRALKHFLLVGLFFHVDKIDNDDAADISEPNLIRNFFDGFQIGLEDGLLEVVFADITDRC